MFMEVVAMKCAVVGSSVLVTAFLAAPAMAGDWYVDAVNGSNSNAGDSPAAAWRTITHALAVAPNPPYPEAQLIHVAPGTYNSALGESFPIRPRNQFRILSDQGPGLTILEAGGGGTVVEVRTTNQIPFYQTFPPTQIGGFTLRNANWGVNVAALGTEGGLSYLRCTDLEIVGMAAGGVSVGAAAALTVNAHATGIFEHVRISGCGIGAQVSSGGIGTLGPIASLQLYDCEVTGSATNGILETDGGNGAQLNCVRTRITDNGGDGIHATHANPAFAPVYTYALIDDCLIARNGAHGMHADSPGGATNASTFLFRISRSTVANNVGSGIEDYFPATGLVQYQGSLDNTIVYGNSDDIHENPAKPGLVSVNFSDIGDGDFAGTNGNFSLDPLFRDALAGDWRLRWGSPCIDTADPALAIGTLDLVNAKRPFDGNLDAIERADLGCFEFAPLWVDPIADLGSNAVIEQWGPDGGRTVLYLSRLPALATPLVTTFGEFDLDPSALRNFGVTRVASGPPALRLLPIPLDPAYVGLTCNLQALSRSTVAVPAAAYTNLASFTIEP